MNRVRRRMYVRSMFYRDNYIAKFIGVVLFIGLVVALISYTDNSNKEKINKEIASRGGEITLIDERVLKIGPFHLKGKNQMVYKVDYKDSHGKEQEAWMRTGLFSDEWIWDYKETE